MASSFDDILFKVNEIGGGFINDVTPLDEYNMNLILKAILENKEKLLDKADQSTIDDLVIDTIPDIESQLNTLNDDMDNTTAEVEVMAANLQVTNGNVESVVNDLTSAKELLNNTTTLAESLVDNDVIVENPSVSIDYAMYGSTRYENPYYALIGSEIQMPTVHLKFNPGKYKYDNDTGIKLTSIKAYTNGSEYHNATDTGVSDNYISISKTLTVENKDYEFEFRCEHNNGSVLQPSVPHNNAQQQLPTMYRIPSGTIITPDKFVVKGYYDGCYCGGAYALIDSSSINKEAIQALNRSGRPYTSGAKYTFTIPSGRGTLIVACPQGKYPKKVINKTVGAPMTTLFGNGKSVKTVNINGQTYSVWMFKPAETYVNEIELEVTLN